MTCSKQSIRWCLQSPWLSYLLVLCIGINQSSAMANEVYFFKSASVSELEFQVFLDSMGRYSTAINYWRNSKAENRTRTELIDLYQKWKTLQLSDKDSLALRTSVETAKLIAAARFREDWNPQERAIILEALSYLSGSGQLANHGLLSSVEREQWQKHLKNYQSNASIKVIRADSKKMPGTRSPLWQIGISPDPSEVFLVDGQRTERALANFLELPPGPHRITFVSNSYRPSTILVHKQPRGSFTLPFNLKPWVKENCENFENEEHLPNGSVIYFSSDCILAISEGKIVRRSNLALKDLVNLNSKPDSSVGSIHIGLKNSKGDLNKLDPEEPPSLFKTENVNPKANSLSGMIRSPWTWAGLALLASIALVVKNQQNPSEASSNNSDRSHEKENSIINY